MKSIYHIYTLISPDLTFKLPLCDSNVSLFVSDGGRARYKQSCGRDRHPVHLPAGLLPPAEKRHRRRRTLTP